MEFFRAKHLISSAALAMLLLISRGQDTAFALGAPGLDAGSESDSPLTCAFTVDVLSEPVQAGGADCIPDGLPDPTPMGGAPSSPQTEAGGSSAPSAQSPQDSEQGGAVPSAPAPSQDEEKGSAPSQAPAPAEKPAEKPAASSAADQPAKETENKSEISDKRPRPYTPLYYGEEPVREIYSFNYNDRSYHRITYYEDMVNVLDLLEGFEQLPVDTPECVGFLIVTERGKYPIYLSGVRPSDNSRTDRLIETAINYNESYTGTVQWVAYMDVSKITNISFNGLGGFGYSLYTYPTDIVFQISLDTNNPATINTIGTFLKNLEVTPSPKIYGKTVENAAPDSYYTLDIEFVSGVVYHLFGYDSGIFFSASDSEGTVVYDCTQNQIKAMRDMMTELRGVSLADA